MHAVYTLHFSLHQSRQLRYNDYFKYILRITNQ